MLGFHHLLTYVSIMSLSLACSVCMYMCAGANTCACVYGAWKRILNIPHEGPLSALRQGSHEPGAYHFQLVCWPPHPMDLPVSYSPALGTKTLPFQASTVGAVGPNSAPCVCAALTHCSSLGCVTMNKVSESLHPSSFISKMEGS